MRQGTTPIETLTVAQEFDNCNVYVTIDQDGTQITKASRTSDDIEITKNYDDEGNFESSSIALYLTQAETLRLEVGTARVQVRWIDFAGDAYASEIGTVNIEESLLQEVIEYGN